MPRTPPRSPIMIWSDITDAFRLDEHFTVDQAMRRIYPNLAPNNYYSARPRIIAALEKGRDESGDSALVVAGVKPHRGDEVWTLPDRD